MVKRRLNGRKFGLTMAAVAAVFALIAWWRHRETAVVVLAVVVAIFALFALIAPRLLEPVESIWMTFSRLLGAVNSRILLTIVYILVIVPTGLVFRLLGRDEMKRARLRDRGTNWEDYRSRQRDPKHYENMF